MNIQNLASFAIAGTVIGGSKVYSNLTGKPVGCPGSFMHVLTNDKIKDKTDCLKEMTKIA